MTKILGKSVATAKQMSAYLLSINPSPKFSKNITVLDFCQLFLDVCAKEGVRGDIAFAQACKETGNFKFKGDVKYIQNNFAGLGATGGGVCGCVFSSIEEGILAQAQHLKTYATKDNLNEPCVDPRRTTWFVNAKGGTSPDVETLCGTWAVPGYSTSKYTSLDAARKAKDSYGYQIITILNNILKIKTDEKEDNSVSTTKMAYDKNTALRIRDFLIAQGLTIEGAYGMMANLYSESGFRANNAQNSCMTRLGMTDEIYTAKVDNNEYTLFATDRVGYGIAQWTSSGRKTKLLNYATSCKTSIGNETMQLNYLMQELKTSYKAVLQLLTTSHDVSECAKYVMTKFERPANQSETNQNKRASFGIQLMKDLEGSVSKDDKKEESTVPETNKINSNLEIRKCILVNNDCYKKGVKIKPNGIVVHSTGANNKKVSRYVQPDDGVIGTNKYNNHWNQGGIKKCVHAFIGVDKNGEICIVQTLPWDYKCWGVGSGTKGSYNNSYIQFEICEDALADKAYFDKAFEAAAELCAYFIKLYPDITIDNVVSHHESYLRGYGGNHSDCDHWLRKFGKDMNWFRSQVAAKVGKVDATPSTPTTSAPSSSAATRTYLIKGDKGNAVKELQENLTYIGYVCGVIDGSFGAKTDDALRRFQKDYKLTVDGKYGTNSRKALEDAVAQKKAAETSSKKYYRVQVGAYGLKGNAEKCRNDLQKAGFDGIIKRVGLLYKVQLGAYSNKAGAESMMAKIIAKGFKAVITYN